MKIKFMLSNILIMTFNSALIIVVFTCCKNQENCPRYVQVPAMIFPALIEYHIGDTITITSKFYHDVLAFNSELKEIGTIDMTELTWQPNTSIARIDTMGQGGISTIDDYFYFVANTMYNYHMFIQSGNYSGLDGSYNYQNDTFDLKIKLIARKVGSFFLIQKCGADFFGKQTFPGRCPGENVDVWVNMNNGGDNNIQLLAESPDPYWNTSILSNPKDNFYNYGGYCFRVVP